MLTAETKRKIDSARNILVGKVPDPKAQVEQITTALIYKFMDDMDKQAASLPKGKAQFFTNGFEKYAWSKVLDVRLGGQERLNLYVEALSRMSKNPHLPQLFRDVFKDAFLPYHDPVTLNLFLKEINFFEYDHSENLGDAFEYLLSVLGAQGNAGQFRTPRHIIDFIVEVVDPKKDETILDPACGTAGFLISAYKHILKSNKHQSLTPDEKKRLMANLAGYDISPDMVKLSLVNMYLHGFPNPNIYEYDTLTSDEKWNERFDIIMANPPFMTPTGGIRPHRRFMVQANRSEVLFVDYIMEHLNNKGRAGIIVPEGIIFQSAGAYKQLRKSLVEDGLYAVVSLPAGVFNPYSGVRTNILFFDNQLAKQTKEILFVKILNDGFDLGTQRRPIDRNDIPHALKVLQAHQNAIKTGKKNNLLKEGSLFALVVPKIQIAEDNKYNLSGDTYNHVVKVFNRKWEYFKLGDICNMYQPKTITSKEIKDRGEFKVFGANGVIGYYNKYNHEDSEVLITCRGATCGTVNVSEPKSWITGNAMVVQPKDERLDKNFLYYALRFSDLKSTISGAAQPQITRQSLAPFKIPLPPLEIQKEIVDELNSYQKVIDGAKQIIAHHKPSIKVDPEWQQEELSNVCKILNGYAFKSKNYIDGGLRVIRITNVQKGEIVDDNPKYYPVNTKEPIEKYKLSEGDLLLSLTGNVGRVGLLQKELLPAALNQRVACLRVNIKKINNKFLFYLLNTDSFEKDCVSASNGVAQKNLSTVWLSKYKIPLPPLETQNDIVAKLEKEQKYTESAKQMVEIYDEKIKSKIAEVWGK